MTADPWAAVGATDHVIVASELDPAVHDGRYAVLHTARHWYPGRLTWRSTPQRRGGEIVHFRRGFKHKYPTYSEDVWAWWLVIPSKLRILQFRHDTIPLGIDGPSPYEHIEFVTPDPDACTVCGVVTCQPLPELIA